MGPAEAGAEVQQVGGVEFGPFGEQPEVIQVSASEPIEGNADLEDFFGEAADDSASEPADDLFGEPANDPFDVGATDEEPAPATEAAKDKSSESEESEPDFDDPFGDF